MFHVNSTHESLIPYYLVPCIYLYVRLYKHTYCTDVDTVFFFFKHDIIYILRIMLPAGGNDINSCCILSYTYVKYYSIGILIIHVQNALYVFFTCTYNYNINSNGRYVILIEMRIVETNIKNSF